MFSLNLQYRNVVYRNIVNEREAKNEVCWKKKRISQLISTL
ncbi:hypothetical protein HMPREF0518_1775 [Lactobacillus helveticus DSM 20075 = CGMCC 1.1877]|nr:hypothetical protein HMPREF0518_1775 [Lactobacillus helveticus DSM 20075 = CGMCC 1.1877]